MTRPDPSAREDEHRERIEGTAREVEGTFEQKRSQARRRLEEAVAPLEKDDPEADEPAR